MSEDCHLNNPNPPTLNSKCFTSKQQTPHFPARGGLMMLSRRAHGREGANEYAPVFFCFRLGVGKSWKSRKCQENWRSRKNNKHHRVGLSKMPPFGWLISFASFLILLSVSAFQGKSSPMLTCRGNPNLTRNAQGYAQGTQKLYLRRKKQKGPPIPPTPPTIDTPYGPIVPPVRRLVCNNCRGTGENVL